MHVDPTEGSVIEVNSQVRATFSSPVRSITVSDKTFSVKDNEGKPVDGKTTLTDNYTTIVFTPVHTFNPASEYSITMEKSIMDISGATMATELKRHFKTEG